MPPAARAFASMSLLTAALYLANSRETTAQTPSWAASQQPVTNDTLAANVTDLTVRPSPDRTVIIIHNFKNDYTGRPPEAYYAETPRAANGTVTVQPAKSLHPVGFPSIAPSGNDMLTPLFNQPAALPLKPFPH